MKRFLLALAVIVVSVAAQDTTPSLQTCPELKRTLRWLSCDGDRFEEEQCITDRECFCVDPMTGTRLNDRSVDRDTLSCDDEPDEPDEPDCPDTDRVIVRCGGRNCVRKPRAAAGETCLQCITPCTGTSDDECQTNADCDDDERCAAVGDFARRMCIDVIVDGGQCVPDVDYDDDDNANDNPDTDVDDDFDDDEEEFFLALADVVDSAVRSGGRECQDNQVCRQQDDGTFQCQARTGVCYSNNGRPVGRADDTAPTLDCDEDSGYYEPRQSNDRQHWCVFPNNGSEVPNTRVSRSSRSPDCDEIVFRRCITWINGRRYSVEHSDRGIRVNNSICDLCRCNNGRFDICSRIRCPAPPTTGTRSCTVRGRTYTHEQTFQVDCNMCKCVNGETRCTRRACEDDSDDDEMDAERCRRMPRRPVCASNLRTYPNLCAAIAAGFQQLNITFGACSRDSICNLHPCPNGYRCIPLATSCSSRSSCGANDFRKCVNTTVLRCRVASQLSDVVCGANNRSYPSVCQLLQQSNTRVRFPGNCSRPECVNSPVCGTDGVTYRSVCDVRAQPDVRVDHRGACLTQTGDETVGNFCMRVRSSNRCASKPNCDNMVRPADGCCSICGGGVSVAYDEDGLDDYDDLVEEARTTDGVRRIMTRSGLVEDTTNKCDVTSDFTSNGDIELLYEAKMDSDAKTCAMRATMVARAINEQASRRQRRQTTDEEVDPIFNYMTVATTLEAEGSNTTGGGGAGILAVSYVFVLISALLVLLM